MVREPSRPISRALRAVVSLRSRGGRKAKIAVAEPVDQIQLPQRARAVERTREDPRDLLRKLRVGGRRRQRQLSHVVLEIEVVGAG